MYRMKIARKGVPTTITGTPLDVDATLPKFNLVDRDGKEYTEKDFEGKNLLISVYPDINTSVCEKQTRKIFELADKLENVEIMNVSNNSVEELNGWCATTGLDVHMLSAQDDTFAENFHLWMPEYEVLARSIFVVDKDGKITYRQVTNDMADEPDYDAALDAIKAL